MKGYVMLEWPECQMFMEGGEHPCEMFFDPEKNVWFISEEDYYKVTPREYFPITSVSREDLKAKGFDTSKVSDAEMERLASKMADDYCEQMFWISLDILAELHGIPKRTFHKGDKVRWNDPGIEDYAPEEREEVLARVFTVDEANGDIILISNEDSSAEVYASELELISEED